VESENELTLDRIDSIQADNDQTDLEEDIKDHIAMGPLQFDLKEDAIVVHDDKEDEIDNIIDLTGKDDKDGTLVLPSEEEKSEVFVELKQDEVNIESIEERTESPKPKTRTEDLSRKSQSQNVVNDDLKTESLVGAKDVSASDGVGVLGFTESPGRCSESDHPSSEPLLSEGEIVQGRRGSEGEISLGGASGMEGDTTLESLGAGRTLESIGAARYKEISASEGEISGKQLTEASSDDQGRVNRNERFDRGGAWNERLDRTGGTVESSSGVGEYLADYSASDGEAALRVAKKKSTASNSNRLRNIGHQRLSLVDTSTSSFSEGEWGAEVSPRQTQRFRNMAAAFRLNKK